MSHFVEIGICKQCNQMPTVKSLPPRVEEAKRYASYLIQLLIATSDSRLLATYLPSRRAMRVEAMATLRAK
jgi:ABC-type lipoprotein release transport system permease subunit